MHHGYVLFYFYEENETVHVILRVKLNILLRLLQILIQLFLAHNEQIESLFYEFLGQTLRLDQRLDHTVNLRRVIWIVNQNE